MLNENIYSNCSSFHFQFCNVDLRSEGSWVVVCTSTRWNKRESGESDENEYTRKLSFFFFIPYCLNNIIFALLLFTLSIFYRKENV